MKKKKIVLYISHGINTTFKETKEIIGRFKELCLEKFDTDKVEYSVFDGSYGYLSTFICLVPFIRKLLVKKVNKDLGNIRNIYGEDIEIVLITYSYSTYLMSKVLMNYKHNISIWNMCASVVHCGYGFSKVKSSINKVYNFCSLEDEVCRVAPKFLGFGHAGYFGFRYANGDKANSKQEGEELVYFGTDGKVPTVVNVRDNNIEHGDYYKDNKFFKLILNNIN